MFRRLGNSPRRNIGASTSLDVSKHRGAIQSEGQKEPREPRTLTLAILEYRDRVPATPLPMKTRASIFLAAESEEIQNTF